MTGGSRLRALADRIFGAGPWWLRALVALQVAAILSLAVVSSLRTDPLVGPDEAQNVSYVQIVAEQGHLPIEDHDCVSNELLRLQFRPPVSCRKVAGSSYEAFQPPLYYLMAAPVWLAVPGVHAKTDALRLFDCLLLACAIAAFWWLCAETLGERRAYGVALGLCGMLIPAVIVEQTFVGNDALELALAPAVLTACLRAARAPDRRRPLVLAALLVGATLLTKLTSVYLLVPFAAAVLVRSWGRREPRRVAGEIALAALVPLLMLAPWLIDNDRHYGRWTADQIAHDYQTPILNPTHERYTWGQIPALDRTIVATYLPKLCRVPQPDAPGEPLRDPLSYLLLAVLLLGPVVLARRREGMAGLCTLLPVGLATLTFDAAHVLAQQYLDIARFLHPTVAPFGAGLALLAGPRRPAAARLIALAAAALTAVVLVEWIRILPGPNPLCP